MTRALCSGAGESVKPSQGQVEAGPAQRRWVY